MKINGILIVRGQSLYGGCFGGCHGVTVPVLWQFITTCNSDIKVTSRNWRKQLNLILRVVQEETMIWIFRQMTKMGSNHDDDGHSYMACHVSCDTVQIRWFGTFLTCHVVVFPPPRILNGFTSNFVHTTFRCSRINLKNNCVNWLQNEGLRGQNMFFLYNSPVKYCIKFKNEIENSASSWQNQTLSRLGLLSIDSCPDLP